MADKIRLKDGTEFTLIPMGIEERDKLRFFKIIKDLPYEETLSKFIDDNNISQIEHVLSDGTVGTTYRDCTSFKYMTYIPNMNIDDNSVNDVYVVALSVDPIEAKLKATQQYIDNAICELTLMMFMIGGMGL